MVHEIQPDGIRPTRAVGELSNPYRRRKALVYFCSFGELPPWVEPWVERLFFALQERIDVWKADSQGLYEVDDEIDAVLSADVAVLLITSKFLDLEFHTDEFVPEYSGGTGV